MSLKQAAADVLAVVDAGRYEVDGRHVNFDAVQNAAVDGTRLYRPADDEAVASAPGRDTTVSVVEGTTQVVAHDLAADAEHLAVLNFASARNVGGGFLNGAKAQEEDLCRCSGLFRCLEPQTEYYQANRSQSSLLYTDHAIFSPRVPFFKTRGTGDYLPNIFEASVITAPAPNTGPYLKRHPGGHDALRATFARRWRNVLRIARAESVDVLVLGAWGCGAFGGDPVMSSQTAREAIDTDGGGIDRIVFAIPGKGRQSRENLHAFERTLESVA